MLNKSRYPSGTSTRQNDVQGSSSRGPYKRWVPSNDYRFSESETDAPKQASHRPRVHHGAAQAIPPSAYSSSAPLPPTTRTSAQQPASSSRQHRSERNGPGYSSESTAHVPPIQPKSGFSFLKHITKDSKSQATAKVSSQPTIPSTTKHSNTRHYPTNSAPRETPTSTSSSADPSPRSSEDSIRNGNMSAPAAINQDKTKYAHALWNPPTEHKSTTSSSKKRESVREEKKAKAKDREDLVAQVTEALAQGSVATKTVENSHIQVLIKSDDASSTRRTTPSTNSSAKTQESHSRLQPQSSRHRTTLVEATHGVEISNSRHPHSSSLTGYPQADSQPRTQTVPDLISRSFTNKAPISTAPPIIPKPSQSHSATSPWPFNQAFTRNNSTKTFQHVSERREALPKLHTTASSATPVNNLARQEEPPQGSAESRGGKSSVNLSNKLNQHAVDLPNQSVDSHGAFYTTTKVLPRESTSHTIGEAGRMNALSSTKTSSRENTGYTTSTRVASLAPNLSSSVNHGVTIPAKADGTSHTIVHHPYSYQTYARVHSNSLRPGQATASLPLPTSSHTSSSKPPTPPELAVPEKEKASRHLTIHSGSNDASTVLDLLGTERPNARRRVDSSASQFVTPGTRQFAAVDKPLPQPILEYPSTSGSSTSFVNGHGLNSNTISTINVSSSSTQGQAIWLPPARHDISTRSAETSGKVIGTVSQMANPSAGVWTSKANGATHTSEPFHAFSQPGPSRNQPFVSPEVGDGVSTPTKEQKAQHEAVSGTWKQSSSLVTPASNTDSDSNDTATPKPLPKATILDDIVILPTKHIGDSSTNMNENAPNLPTAIPPATYGAWTTTKASFQKPHHLASDLLTNAWAPMDHQFQSHDPSLRQATLAPGTWTTKAMGTSTPQPRSSAQTTPRPTPPRNPSPPPEVSSEAIVGNGAAHNVSSSSTNTFEVNTISLVQPSSTRVPISGHPSTPAPTRPVLRSVPPPLSFSESTVPDNESLLTPSSLNNSPRPESMMFALSQAASTTTPVFVPQPAVALEEKASKTPKKGGFFEFLKPKPAQPAGYEFWTPPTKDQSSSKQDSPSKGSAAGLTATALLARSKPGNVSTPIPIPASRAKSPKLFSPLKLFSRRHRTVSTASLDALDGITANTIMNSPASSMHADMAGGPPSPPIRDPFLATQEWRNKEAEGLILSGRRRQPRPGVTFDCPDDVAPIDYVRPRLVRTPRPYSGSDEEED